MCEIDVADLAEIKPNWYGMRQNSKGFISVISIFYRQFCANLAKFSPTPISLLYDLSLGEVAG